MQGRVVSIHRVAGRSGPAVPLDEARFVADFGLVGDWRSASGRARQVSLVEAEALEAVAAVLGLDVVPPGASRRQVVLRGVSLDDALGRQIRLGQVIVAVEERGDPCANMEAKIGPGARAAMAGRGGVCGRVIEGGVVRPGDTAEVVR